MILCCDKWPLRCDTPVDAFLSLFLPVCAIWWCVKQTVFRDPLTTSTAAAQCSLCLRISNLIIWLNVRVIFMLATRIRFIDHVRQIIAVGLITISRHSSVVRNLILNKSITWNWAYHHILIAAFAVFYVVFDRARGSIAFSLLLRALKLHHLMLMYCVKVRLHIVESIDPERGLAWLWMLLELVRGSRPPGPSDFLFRTLYPMISCRRWVFFFWKYFKRLLRTHW